MKHNFDYCIFILPFLKWILYLEEWYHYLSPILKSNQSVHLLLPSPAKPSVILYSSSKITFLMAKVMSLSY